MFDTKIYTQEKLRSKTVLSSIPHAVEPPIEIRDKCLGKKTHFLSVVNIINAIGNLQHGSQTYYITGVGGNGPHSIHLTNLRQCLNLCRDGPQPTRRDFHRLNPFPFATWEVIDGDPRLTNADEIMPAVYTLEQFTLDLEVCKQYFELVCRK